tara:strand:- start:854 stop:1039 length:186 start_codon:yes stop_codon:yes gene_type:complete
LKNNKRELRLSFFYLLPLLIEAKASRLLVTTITSVNRLVPSLGLRAKALQLLLRRKLILIL